MFLIPSAPPNEPAIVKLDAHSRNLEILYDGHPIFEGRVSAATTVNVRSADQDGKVEQTITFDEPSVSIDGTVTMSTQSFAAETMGPQQERFPEVRNSDGPSYNLRNNSIYDRALDSVFIGPSDGHTVITPLGKGKYRFQASGPNLTLLFRPRFYSRHKNIQFFEPWKRPVRHDSTAGWCSWWAYFDKVTEADTLAAADVFSRKLKDFGYDTIQLDDGYEGSSGAPPEIWLNTNPKFPSGLDKLAHWISALGLRPGIWIGTQISDEKITEQHPDWFVRNADGKPHKGPWIGYGVDGSNKAALDHLFKPVFDKFHQDGFRYVKIDSIRHLLYDSLYPCREQMAKEGVTPEQAFRDYLEMARHALGDETYILACWGVLPEAAGIVDACRLGGDGFGPSTLLQYNSWNNVVWRNDPDHVDIHGDGEDIIRPTLVSMAGAQLLLSDKAEFYEQDARLEGAKRAAPIPFTLPGQLYDFDPSKTNNLIKGLRNQNGGAQSGPIDADQHGPESQWWQLDVSRPYENWTVLARLSWHELASQNVSFSNLGLPPGKYAVYEFWSKRYLGDFEGSFPAAAQPAKGTSVYCIRAALDHPQVISTSRHITQGGPDLLNASWNAPKGVLSGRSKVVHGDPYEVRVRLAGYRVLSGSFPTETQGDEAILRFTPAKSGDVDWSISFEKPR